MDSTELIVTATFWYILKILCHTAPPWREEPYQSIPFLEHLVAEFDPVFIYQEKQGKRYKCGIVAFNIEDLQECKKQLLKRYCKTFRLSVEELEKEAPKAALKLRRLNQEPIRVIIEEPDEIENPSILPAVFAPLFNKIGLKMESFEPITQEFKRPTKNGNAICHFLEKNKMLWYLSSSLLEACTIDKHLLTLTGNPLFKLIAAQSAEGGYLGVLNKSTLRKPINLASNVIDTTMPWRLN